MRVYRFIAVRTNLGCCVPDFGGERFNPGGRGLLPLLNGWGFRHQPQLFQNKVEAENDGKRKKKEEENAFFHAGRSGNRVDPARMEGMALQKPAPPQKHASKQAMTGYRFTGIV